MSSNNAAASALPVAAHDRRSGIGASEAGAVLGLSHYTTALDVYQRKVGQGSPEEASEAIYWGKALEGAVLRRYADDTGRALDTVQRVFRSAEHPWMTATPDAVASDRLVEAKTAGMRSADQWGEPGTDAVPPVYLVQVMHQMIVTGHRLADLAVLIGGQDYRVYAVPYDAELAGIIIEREREFWAAVEARKPPEPTTLAAAFARWPKTSGEARPANAEEFDNVQRLKTLRADIARAEEAAEGLELAIKVAMGEVASLTDSQGKALVTWTNQPARRFDGRAFQKAHAELYESFRVASVTRVFRLK